MNRMDNRYPPVSSNGTFGQTVFSNEPATLSEIPVIPIPFLHGCQGGSHAITQKIYQVLKKHGHSYA